LQALQAGKYPFVLLNIFFLASNVHDVREVVSFFTGRIYRTARRPTRKLERWYIQYVLKQLVGICVEDVYSLNTRILFQVC